MLSEIQLFCRIQVEIVAHVVIVAGLIDLIDGRLGGERIIICNFLCHLLVCYFACSQLV